MSLQKVRQMLSASGVEYRFIRLKKRAVSVNEVVKYAEDEVKEDEICKTVLLRGASGRLYAVMLLGMRKVDLAKVAQIVKEKVSLASLSELEKLGLEPGAICPLTIDVELLVDEEVFTRQKVNFSSGDPHYGLEVSPKDLEKLVEFRRARLSSP